jgi:site-specific DNA-methyltransferase (adenine-specific)
VVLDPFGGSGTTAAVAMEEGRSAILCELNPDYIPLINERLSKVQPNLL